MTFRLVYLVIWCYNFFVQLIGFLMSDTGYLFSPTIDAILGGIELFGFDIWLGISIGKRRS